MVRLNEWSPSQADEAQRLLDKAVEAEKAQEIRKSNAAELRETTRKLKQKLEAEKVEIQEREKKERNERKATECKAIDKRKVERERKKQGRDSQRAIQIAAKGKHKASTAAEPVFLFFLVKLAGPLSKVSRLLVKHVIGNI
jgi:hypothetical protein